MSEKGFGTITISDLQDGSQIWTTTTAPVSPNYTFTISNLTGDTDAEIKVGDMIFYSTNRYTVLSVGTTTVQAGLTQSLKGDKGDRGTTWYSGTAITGTSTTPASYATGIASAIVGDHYINTSTQNVYVCTTAGNASTAKWKYEENFKGRGVTSITPQFYLSTSNTQQSGGSWANAPADYVKGRYYWTRSYIVWTDGDTTTTTPVLDNALTMANENAYDAMVTANKGLGMKLNYSAFSTSDSGEVYLHGYTDGIAADVDGYVMWNGLMRTVAKGMINPNAIVPYNRYIYIVLRLSSASSTTGTNYMVWYNSGWKYAVTPTPTQVGGTWTWDETKDIVLGQFIEPGSEQDVVEAYLYEPPRNASQVQTTNVSPYQYSQSAVEWNAANGNTTVNATSMLKAWIDNAAFSNTAEMDGGFLKAHTIQSEHLATDAIMSNNFEASPNPSSPYSATGTFLDLTNGNLYTPNLGIDNVYGTAYLNGEIIARNGRIGNSNASNYWEIGTKTDYNAQQSAALVGVGTAYIQTGDFQLSNGLLNTQMYDSNNQITYLYNNSTYWDFGIQAPELNTSATGYVAGVDDNFIYIRNHENTIPSLKTEWNYIFRVDKNGMIYINGKSLDEKYASIDGVSGEYLPRSGGTITGNLTVNGAINGTATKATQLTHWISINGTQWDGNANTTIGTLGVAYGGTGATTFTSGHVLIGNGQNAVTTRAIRNNTSAGALGWTSSSTDNTLITTNTLAYWDGRYQASGNKSNLKYVKLGKLGDVVTHDFDEFITTDGGIIDGSLQVTDLTAGNLIVTGAGRFTNGLYGDLTGNASTADKVNKDLIIKLASGTTEGTNMFTFNGSTAKTVDITKSAIGLGNVENTKLSTWAGSANLTTTKVGTLAGAAVKAVDTSISAGSTSTNLPTSAAVASFVEGKGYVTSSGVTSVRVQATSPVVSSVNTAQSSTLNTTISLADGYGDTKNPYASKTKNYVLAAPSGENGVPTFRALVADDIPALASSKVGLGNVTNNKQVKGLASGTTSGHLVSWGTDGYTVADAGIAKGGVATKLTLAGSDYSASSNTITVTQANLQSAVQSTGLVLMTSAERSKLASIQVSEGGTIDFSGVTASAPLTATVSTDKKVNITHDTSGVSAGTYRSVTVDAYGHVTAGTNPTTLSGYGITDAKIASGVITLGSNTITPLTASSSLNAAKLTGTASVSTTGNAGTATKFSSARSITLTGDTTGTASADGSSGWSIATATKSITSLGRIASADIDNSTQKSKVTFSLASSSMTESKPPAGDGYILTYGWDNSGWAAQTYVQHTKTPSMMFRGATNGTGNVSDWGDWIYVLSSSNYTNYTVKKDGTGATGTWGISITGNAATATSATSAASATTAGKWTSAQTVYVTLGTASKTTTIQGGSSTAQTIGVDGTLAVANGGTGKTTWSANGIVYASGSSALGQLGTGTSGQVLTSGGSSAPTWTSQSSLAVGSATKATQDGSGNVITDTYVNLTGTQTISGAKTFSAVTSFSNTTASTSKTTGAVKVSGGLGVAGAIHGQTVSVDDAVTMQYNSSTASLDFVFN